jgi:NADPH:quinone reductase-like Zn-dependent oxidoreductase
MQQWIAQGNTGFNDLKLVDSPVPEVSENDVLVKLHAVSLNSRDLMIAKVGDHRRRFGRCFILMYISREPPIGQPSPVLFQRNIIPSQ